MSLVVADHTRVDASGSRVIVAGLLRSCHNPWDDYCPLGPFAGTVHVYAFDGWGWSPEADLGPTDLTGTEAFGWDVAIDGDWAVVGAPYDSQMLFRAGAAFVFRHDGVRWIEHTRLAPSEEVANQQFGTAVTIHDGRIVCGAPHTGVAAASIGEVYVFRYDEPIDAWTLESRLSHPAQGTGTFGSTLDLAADVLIVSQRSSDASTALIFRLGPNGWAHEATLTGTSRFGASVSASQGLVAVGDPRDDEAGHFAGAVYVYEHDSSGWRLQAKLLPDGLQPDQQFGSQIAMEGDLLIGAIVPSLYDPQWVALFERAESGWVESARIGAPERKEAGGFGLDLAVDGRRVCIGGAEYSLWHGWLNVAGIYDVDDLDGDDCNSNDVCDDQDVTDGTSVDCNGNGVPDECDVLATWSADCQGDGIPDECQPDCNANGMPDDCDIAIGTSDDCNLNGIPDECDPAYQLDDGTSSTGLGLVSNGRDFLWLNQFRVQPGYETITALAASFRWTDGIEPVTLLLFDDPTDDGDPGDAVLARSVEGLAPRWEPGPERVLTLPIEAHHAGGAGEVFYVGALMTISVAYPAAMDSDTPANGRSMYVLAEAGHMNLTHLADNPTPPSEVACCDGVWMLRAVASSVPTCTCPGDIDRNGVIDPADLLAIILAWGEVNSAVDFTGDGIVDVDDLIGALLNWGSCQ